MVLRVCAEKERERKGREMREWLSGGVSPCQGEGRGFESRLALLESPDCSGLFYLLGHGPVFH